MGPGGRVEDFPRGSVTPSGDGISRPLVFHVVRLPDGEFLALSARNVFRRSECSVSYHPDFVAADGAGWFRDSCYPFTFDMAGYPVNVGFRPPLRLDHLGLEVRDGSVYVDPHAIASGRGVAAPEGYDFQYGGILLPTRYQTPAR